MQDRTVSPLSITVILPVDDNRNPVAYQPLSVSRSLSYSHTTRPSIAVLPRDAMPVRYVPDMELGHWVTGSMGHLSHVRVTGSSFWPGVRPEFFRFSKKMLKMQKVHLKCWNDKSHCLVSVVARLKSLDVSRCNKLLLLPVIIKNSLAWEYFFATSMIRTPLHISRHLEFIIEQGHRVNWVSGSLDSRVSGSLGHKMWPSSMSGVCHVLCLFVSVSVTCASSAKLAKRIELVLVWRLPFISFTYAILCYEEVYAVFQLKWHQN